MHASLICLAQKYYWPRIFYDDFTCMKIPAHLTAGKIFRAKIREIFLYRGLFRRRPATPRIKFAIIYSPRVGSTLLTDLIRSHPLIECDMDDLFTYRAFSACLLVKSRLALANKQIYGFKFYPRLWGIRPQRIVQPFITRLHHSGWKFLHLTRRDLWAQALSLCLAFTTGHWHQLAFRKRPPERKIRIDFSLLVRCFEQLESNQRIFTQCIQGIPCMDLVYEDHLLQTERHQRTADIIFDYLAVPRIEVSTRLLKQTKKTYAQMIENYSEIETKIRGTPYAVYLDQSETQREKLPC